MSDAEPNTAATTRSGYTISLGISILALEFYVCMYIYAPAENPTMICMIPAINAADTHAPKARTRMRSRRCARPVLPGPVLVVRTARVRQRARATINDVQALNTSTKKVLDAPVMLPTV
jgi:hypothetical protein